MVACSDFCGFSRKRGCGFGALAQTIGTTAISFLRPYVVLAAKTVGADLIELAAPEIGNVLAEKKVSNLQPEMLERRLYVNK